MCGRGRDLFQFMHGHFKWYGSFKWAAIKFYVDIDCKFLIRFEGDAVAGRAEVAPASPAPTQIDCKCLTVRAVKIPVPVLYLELTVV